MELIKEWPILQATARTGKTKYWQIRVLMDGETALTEVEYWLEGGKHQTASKKVAGKNIGKANETTPQQQALSEAQSQFQKQVDEGYSEDGNAQLLYELPMLAHDFNKRGHNIAWPCYIQPKLDGYRCLYDSQRGFWSRNGKPFDKIIDLSHLHFDTQGLVFDGELMLPTGSTFQAVSKAIKKDREATRSLELYIFDVISPDTFAERWQLLQELKSLPAQVKIVPTLWVESLADAQLHFGQWVSEGYEGMMLRNGHAPYLVGHRSADLQKYKEFEDAEYTILDVVDGVGREEGAAIYVCEANGKRFQVRPRGSYVDRKKIYLEKETVIGRSLTVRYQNLTEDDVPRFPVGIAIREEWDK